jgi:hypothetical protein
MLKRVANRTGSLSSAVALVVGGIVLPAGAANLLSNPSFESPTDPNGNTDSIANGWSLYGDEKRAQFAAHTGVWGMWHETFAPSKGFGGVFQNVGNITVGATYTLSAYQFFESAVPTIPNEVSDIAITFLNASNQTVGTVDPNGYSDALYTPAGSAITGSWSQYTVSGVAPTGATQVQVSFDFVNGSTVTGQQGIFVDDADLEGPGIPPLTAQWANTGSGDWNSSGNWSTGSVPNAVDGEADFLHGTFGITSNSTVYTNVPVIVGTMKFDNANVCEIAGTGNLTLQTSTGNASITVNQGTDIIDLPLMIASNTTFTVNSTADLIIANPITINSGKSLTQAGAGSVIYQSIITVQSAASIAFEQTTHAHQLSVAATGNASITSSDGSTTLTLDGLSNNGTLNVANNELVINYGGPGGSGSDPVNSIRSQLTSGYNGGAWNGPGIDSTSAAAHAGYALGYADAADPGNPAGLASGTLEVLYTLQGDVNLDRSVNGVDFGVLAANFNKGVTAWDQGDFNYDNAVNGVDFGELAANFNKGASGAAAGATAADYAALDAFAAANGLLADVPEPATLGLLAVAAATTLSRRRHRGSTG